MHFKMDFGGGQEFQPSRLMYEINSAGHFLFLLTGYN